MAPIRPVQPCGSLGDENQHVSAHVNDPLVLWPCSPTTNLSGGGHTRGTGVSEPTSQIWPRTGTQQANETHMHCALRAVELEAFGQGHTSDSLMCNGVNYPAPHGCLTSCLRDFASHEQQLLVGNQHGISHTSNYLMKVMREGKCHMLIFSDQVHWRVLLLDGRSKVAYCVDPYGNQGPVSFMSSRARQVLHALQDMLGGRAGWRIQVTHNPWQQSNDGHSCGMWVIWLCERFMEHVATCTVGSDFESWAAQERPCQKDLRARYHDMYHDHHSAHQGRRQARLANTRQLQGRESSGKRCKQINEIKPVLQWKEHEQGPALSLPLQPGPLVARRAQGLNVKLGICKPRKGRAKRSPKAQASGNFKPSSMFQAIQQPFKTASTTQHLPQRAQSS